MTTRRAAYTRAASAVLAVAILGCSIRTQSGPAFEGTYRGTTPDGRTVLLSVTEDDGRLWGDGRLGDEPLVMSGAVGRCAIGRLVGRDGRPVAIALDLAPNGSLLRFERATGSVGDDAIILARDEPQASRAGGAFSGRFESRRRGVVAVEMVLEQRGSLVSGWADIMGTSAGVAGRIDDRDHFVGSALLADGSEMPLDATLDDDGQTLAIRSQGLQCRMTRR
jgi:hypothetical protein